MTPQKIGITARFLEHHGRKNFYVLLQPASLPVKGSVLFLPPFAEEMHRSRHIVAQQAREFATVGYNVLLLDLFGCGDSGGDFADASWQVWREDAVLAANTLANLSSVPLVLWGLRMGALLACELSKVRSDVSRLIFWQPVLNGEQQIDQFLRLRSTAAVTGNLAAFDRKTLWNELRSGRSLDVSGYTLSPALALEMAKVRLNDFCPNCPVHWFEVAAAATGRLGVASEKVIAHWREQGIQVTPWQAHGEPFWRNSDAKTNFTLQRKTLDLLVQQ